MSVIAKLIVRDVHQFGSGSLTDLSCICDNDLMAAYAETEQDRLFTKYSPWGEMKVHQNVNFSLGKKDDAFYVMILAESEWPETIDYGYQASFPGAFAHCPARCLSITDFGDNQAKRLEFTDNWTGAAPTKPIERLNWKMSVDNPGATNQIRAGGLYHVILYPAAHFDRDRAIAAAHGHGEGA